MNFKTYPYLVAFAALFLSVLAQAAPPVSEPIEPKTPSWESQYDFGGEFGGLSAMLKSRKAIHGSSPLPVQGLSYPKAASWERQYDFGGEFGGLRAMVESRKVIHGSSPLPVQGPSYSKAASWESQYDFGGEFRTGR